MSPPADPRAAILQALEADLVGPFRLGDDATPEVLPLPPSRWYLTGFLACAADRDPVDATSDDALGAGSDEDDEDADSQEPEPKQRKFFPASIGLSVLLGPPPAKGKESVRVTVRFAEYTPEDRKEPGQRRARRVWRRQPRGPFTFEVPLEQRALLEGVAVPDTSSVRVHGELALAEAPGLPEGTRALSLFLVNHRAKAAEPGLGDAQYLFQVSMELERAAGFVPRANRQGESARDWDDRVADLQFRERCEWAVGHGVSVEVPEGQGDRVTRVRTTWVPRSEVRRVATHELPGVTSMEQLAEISSGAALRTVMSPLLSGYAEWLKAQASRPIEGERRAETQRALLEQAERARDRIEEGIERLAADPELLQAFRWTNEVMAMSALKRSPHRYDAKKRPAWRLFQLAFLLLNVAGISDERHADRSEVELIFFPTGGGKTEAYLGVIAFTLILRRLRGQAREDKGLGVAVLLRYTLRLLTLDQLGRAATLICALERLRDHHPELGAERFTVGLWVGRTATANTLEQVKRSILEYKNNRGPSPFPLVSCPWCDHPLDAGSFTLEPSPARPEGVVAACVRIGCEFTAKSNREGLPVLFVDEQVYRELPCFLVATVDKFAMMPWRAETGMLFGRATAREGRRFFGPSEASPKGAVPLSEPLRPPELIVQDELHLISGPLGTMVGLYETAIEHLSSRTVAGQVTIPKIIASTATVRRAREQIRALFGRPSTSLFPPPGVDESETWFATVNRTDPGRLYVGVAAQGRALKGILLRAYVALLTAAQRSYDPKDPPDQLPDAYMTLAGYFNSLRELGGMRRLVEDEVGTRALQVEDRRPLDGKGPHPWNAKRTVQMEPVELTSRESTGKIKAAKDRLNKHHADKEHVDVLLASNMISVGVDIDRLGLMVIAGQPKTTSEYIQASSRVGRAHPGLVVTCFNVAKPRDRSHYERFTAYHESFYRFVEATSLTPFSGPALERGLTGTLIAMTRLGDPALTPGPAAMQIAAHRGTADAAIKVLASRAVRHDDLDAEEAERLRSTLAQRGMSLVDAWEQIVRGIREEGAGRRCYSPFDKDRGAGNPLLFMGTDENQPEVGSDEARFKAPTSMRDVEESVHLWVERRALGGRGR